MVNLWNEDKVTVDELMGDEQEILDEEAQLEEADRMALEAEEAEAAGWCDGLLADDDDVAALLAQYGATQ